MYGGKEYNMALIGNAIIELTLGNNGYIHVNSHEKRTKPSGTRIVYKQFIFVTMETCY